MKSILCVAFLLVSFVCNQVSAQKSIQHVEPPHWWVGMENPYLELLIHGDNISGLSPKIDEAGVKIISVVPGDSPNYLFIGLDLSACKNPKSMEITLSKRTRKIKIPYELKARRAKVSVSDGISQKDAIYLITPDRFRNGDETNDNYLDYKEKKNRTDAYGRHGGDIQGISQSLDYIKNIGFNTIWLNPVLENNMKSQSYHGYATTDYYAVDMRYGGNEQYEKLRENLEAKGMKLIMDMIANHCGSEHWWMEDFPFQDWLNYQDDFIKSPIAFNKLTNHRKTTIVDPYVATADRDRMTDGWFVPTMPDLNQRNPHMATYIIQNSIWWVETMNLAGIRQDTYSYPDENFLSDWSCSLLREFPNLFIVGEEWSDNPLITSYWQSKGDIEENQDLSESCLPSVMDFPMQMIVNKAIKDEETWNTGLPRMYELLANDVLYSDPTKLVIFPDNHDMDRIFTQLEENFDLWKMSMIYYATMRGVPQIYYGTELVMSHTGTSSHGAIRSEFHGGWEDHKKSAFTLEGLSSQELGAYTFITRLYNWRSSCKSIHEGQLIHYVPQEGVYVYFRYLNNQQVMVIFNKNNERTTIDLTRFASQLNSYSDMTDVMENQQLKINKSLVVPGMTAKIYEMKW